MFVIQTSDQPWGATTAQVSASLLDQIRALVSPDGYSYDAQSVRYRNDTTGQYVTFREIYSLLDMNVESNTRTLHSLCLALRDERINEAEWYAGMQLALRRMHLQNAALGAGGFDAMTPRDFMRMDQILRDDMERLVKFGQDISNYNLTEKQIRHRADMYAGTARREYYHVRKPPKHRINQIVIERRLLNPADHCSWCIYLNQLGWQQFGVLPVPGESSDTWDGDQCYSSCKCDLETVIVGKKKGEKLLAKATPFVGEVLKSVTHHRRFHEPAEV